MNRLSAILVGGLAGAALAIFLAPSSGTETRRRLRRTATDLGERASEQLREGRMRVTELVRTGQERAEDLGRRAEEQACSTLDEARRSAEEIGRRAEEQLREPSRPPLGPDVGL